MREYKFQPQRRFWNLLKLKGGTLERRLEHCERAVEVKKVREHHLIKSWLISAVGCGQFPEGL
jgi:hypothetical protein